MLENVTIDSVLRDYYCAISSDKLSDDNINIDTTVEVDDSFNMYLKKFNMFLLALRKNGYIISESIFKKFMDIIEYEGYESTIITEYINIICNTINIELEDIYRFEDFNVPSKECIDNINKYLETLHHIADNNIMEINNNLFEDDGKDAPLKMISEIEYPIDYIYKTIINPNNLSLNEIAESAYLIYKNNISAYYSLIEAHYDSHTLFFLLDEDNNTVVDILCDKITSIDRLKEIVEDYYNYTGNFSKIANNNIRRFIELFSINLTLSQTAMVFGKDYGFWNKFDKENPHKLDTLTKALFTYHKDMARFSPIEQLDFISMIKSKYSDDAYFYARCALMFMPYDLFCNNFIFIFNELKDAIEKEKLTKLFIECVYGLRNLFNEDVNTALDKLHDELVYIIEKDYENTKNIFNADEIKVIYRVKSEIDYALHTLQSV